MHVAQPHSCVMLDESQVEGVDIEMTGICNLKCPLCLSQLPQTKCKFTKNFIDIQKLEDQLSKFKSLKLVSIAGDASEPTLHPQLAQFLDYLKGRHVFVELYTNANTHDDAWWQELNTHFTEDSKVFFTICGTSQELHEKYRVGSNLDDVIRHAFAFKRNNPNKNDCMQYIKFEYNKNDNYEKAQKLLAQFSDYEFVETDPIYERLHLDEDTTHELMCSTRVFAFFYKKKLMEARAKAHRKILCYSFENKYVRIDNFNNVSPCVCYMLYDNSNFIANGKLDYSKICNDQCSFCYECDESVVRFLEKNNRDAFYMC